MTKMHSEAEIRKQVETRLRRWALLLLNVVAWAGAAKALAFFARSQGLGWPDLIASPILLVMLLWASLIGLHVLRTLYVEVRDIAVRRAVEREWNRYAHYEKPKRLEISDDGELVDFAEAPPRHENEQIR